MDATASNLTEPVEAIDGQRLILSTVPDDFDPTRDIAAGPWCFLYAEEKFPDWEALSFPEPFSTRECIIEADAKSSRLANHLLAALADQMNERHGRTYSRGYWRTLMIMWIVTATQAFWARYRRIEQLVEEHGEKTIAVQIVDDLETWNFPSILEFTTHLNHDTAFDFWMSSIIVRALAPANWRLETIAAPAKSARVGSASLNAPQSRPAVRLLKKIIPRFSFESVYGVGWSKIFLSCYLSLLPKRQNARVHYTFEDDSILDQFPGEFRRLLDHFLRATLPETYGSGFERLEADALKLKFVPGRIYVDSLGAQADTKRFVLAHALENGEKLVCNQHGGGYGAGCTLPRAAEADFKYHAMLTWGWSEQEDLVGRFIPLPSPLLNRHRNGHRFKRDTLIMVGNPMDVRGHRFQPGPVPSQWIKYRRMKLDFMDALGTDSRAGLIYRPYLRGVTRLQDEEFIRRERPDVPILYDNLHGEMLSCRLLVMDNPGTTLYLAMAYGVPTVCYWDPDSWPLARQAAPYFEALTECGILHDNPESAARHIDKIWDNVPDWWSSTNVLAARQNWSRQFARTSRFWLLDWMRALAKL